MGSVYKSRPSCNAHSVPDDPSLHVSESPLSSSWLWRFSLGHPALVAGSFCLAHIQTQVCPQGTALGTT